jgi:hypothetical protein
MDDLKEKLKTILPSSINKFVSEIYDNISSYRFLWWYHKIARIVKDTPFNPKAVFPLDFEVKNSGLCRLIVCKSKDKSPAPIGIVQIKNKLTKMALKKMYSFAKQGGKFVAIPMYPGIPTRQQVKICSLTGYTTLKPADYLKQIPNISLGITDFLPIGRFNPKTIEKEYDFLIITWARDIYHKRWDIVIKLIEELCPRYKILILAYQGKPSNKDLTIIKKYEASGQLKFINQWISKEEFPILMQKCKVLIVPSEKDNQPRILDQALLSNIPLAVNKNLYGGKKLICERTGKLSPPENLAECSEWVLQNLANKTETRSWYLQYYGPYNATRRYTAFINKVFGTNYRLVCMEGYEFMFTPKYMNSIDGLPEDYQDLRIEEPNLKSEKKSWAIETHLNWSKYKAEFLDHLKNQPIRELIKERIIEYIKNEGFSKIMEIGFGSGYEYKRLKEDLKKYNVKYVGVEYTPKFVEKAQKKYPEAEWIQGDIRKLDFKDDAVDLIFVYHVLEHQKGLEDVKKAIKEMCRVAKKKVIIIWFKAPSIVDETRKWRDGNFFVYKYSAADIWRAVLETDFIVKEILWENPWHNTVWILEKKKKPKVDYTEQLKGSIKTFAKKLIR